MDRTLYRICVVALICLIGVGSIQAQDFDPTPTPRPNATNTILTEVSDAVDRIGIFNFVSAGLIVLFGLGVWIGLKPLIQHGTDANKRADEVTKQMLELTDKLMAFQEKQSEREAKLDDTRRAHADSLAQTVEAQKGLANIMSKMETKEEAREDRRTSVDHINQHTTQTISVLEDHVNQHTTQTISAVNNTLSQMSETVSALSTELKQKVTKTELNDGIKPLLEKLEIISSEISDVRNMVASLLPGEKPVQPLPES